MSVYTVPALNAVDFALTAHTVPSLRFPTQALSVYTVPALSAVDFALTAYTVPTFVYIGWELLSTFPTQFDGLRVFYGGSVKTLCLVAVADAPSGLGGRLLIDKNGTTLCAYLVETSDPNASSVRMETTAGTKALRLKT